ncbi:MurR/RpiR family transcriptional regulator [Fusibacter tunisiensis]|uniref:DNA-binding MurR/RpiR family transcriptional regulator n=1 Tax=Fusibacter tunisiensis TaxID=1008308 RepID=A0ABS2MQE6_9FIRM|nr:MurR/RpiR family transcriptional regulator [Fusibacter tunisiensis]MBM7561542.1 DNA-binding MurR/RpiR family transcriptional regulator [Fusibacter tunisiensis]
MAKADLLARIRQEYIGLSKSHKKIADYILENYDKVAFMTASTLGKKVNISESTVVRFAGSIGYEGYPELQRELQESIKSKLTTVQRFEMSKGQNDTDCLARVMMSDMENIRHSIEHLDVPMIEVFVGQLIKARKVYILGLRSSSILANYLGFYLNFILPEVVVIRETAQDVYDQLLNISQEDVLIAFSFPRYSKRTYDCVDYALSNGINILGITDGLNSPLYDKTPYCLTAKYNMNTFVDSLVAPMSLINALIIGTSMKKEGVEQNLAKLERIWENYGVYNNK